MHCTTHPFSIGCLGAHLVGQVRRVEEQEQILSTLAKSANIVYDCAVKTFPSADGEITQQ